MPVADVFHRQTGPHQPDARRMTEPLDGQAFQPIRDVSEFSAVMGSVQQRLLKSPGYGNGTAEPLRVDLTALPLSAVKQLLNQLVRQNTVLHGSISDQPYEQLDPGKSKLSGKVPSVYATTDPRVALMNAVFNAHGSEPARIRQQEDGGHGFSAAMNIAGKQDKIFQSPPGIAAAMKKGLAEGPEGPYFQTLFKDGFIYVLPMDQFTQENPKLGPTGQRVGGTDHTDHEWNGDHSVTPVAVLKVSKALAAQLIKMDQGDSDTVHVYTAAEMRQRQHLPQPN